MLKHPQWRTLALTALLLALVASLAANVALYRQADESYRRLSEAQLDPYGLRHPGFPADPAPDGRSLVVFYGDSRALAWPAPNLPALRFASRGIGGQTTAQILGRLDAHLTPLAPRVVVI